MSYHHLTMDERNVIYRMQFQGYGQVEIARCLGRHRSTISRECKRNGSVEGRYDPGNALAVGGQVLIHLTRPGRDRALPGGDPSAVTIQGQGRRCLLNTSPYPLSCLWPNAKNPRALGAKPPTSRMSLCYPAGSRSQPPVALRILMRLLLISPWYPDISSVVPETPGSLLSPDWLTG